MRHTQLTRYFLTLLAFPISLIMLLLSFGHVANAQNPPIAGGWVTQVVVWNNEAQREQALTRFLVLAEDGTYKTTIRVQDETGVAHFPTVTGHYAWEMVAGTHLFCVTPDLAAQHYPHCVPLVVDSTTMQWGDVVFHRVSLTVVAPYINGTDPDPVDSLPPEHRDQFRHIPTPSLQPS
jgi:hypothetical protein